MKIVFVHDSPLPVLRYGGTERIIYWLMKELVVQGHEVFLIGHPSSQVEKIGVRLINQELEKNNWHKLIPDSTDLIHLFFAPQDPPPCPYVVTIEGNGRQEEKFPLNTVFVSRVHAANHGSKSYVYNGLDLQEYPWQKAYEEKKSGHYLFLAKASWKVKNLSDCIWACKKNHQHLHIAGGRSWWPSRFIHSHGMVDIEGKAKLFSKCQTLLFPVRWHEPFGIAMIEAMACGLSVFGSTYGSLPEVISPRVGKTLSNKEQLAQALEEQKSDANKGQYDPLSIRQYVEEKFSSQKMAQDYIQIYRQVLEKRPLNTTHPSWGLKLGALDLLPF